MLSLNRDYCVNKGFTLLELVIVMAITVILTSIAYPSYTEYLIKTRRCDGQSALLDLANRLEQYFSEHQTYQSASIASHKTTDVLSSSESAGHWYHLSITHQSDEDYSIKATPFGPQASDTCQALSFNSQGIKSATAANEDNTIQCWS